MADSFHLSAIRNEPHVVYVACDAAGRALYVGCTRNLKQRMRGHRRSSSPWLPCTDLIEEHGHSNWWAARLDEIAKIRSLAPEFNTTRMVTGKDHANWQWMADNFDPEDVGGTHRRYKAWVQGRREAEEADRRAAQEATWAAHGRWAADRLARLRYSLTLGCQVSPSEISKLEAQVARLAPAPSKLEAETAS